MTFSFDVGPVSQGQWSKYYYDKSSDEAKTNRISNFSDHIMKLLGVDSGHS